MVSLHKYLLILAVSYPASLVAQNLEDSRLYRSAYYLGRGDTGIAFADGHEAIFYNPAGLAKGKGIYKETVFVSPGFELSQDTKDLARKIASEENTSPSTLRSHVGQNQHIGFSNFTGVVFRRAALGGLVNNHTNALLSKSADNNGVELLEANSTTNMMGTFSIAEGFFNQFLLVGTTIKYLQQSYSSISVNVIDSSNLSDQLNSDDNQNSYTGTGADLGMMLQWPGGRSPFSLGLTIENVGGLTLANEVATKDDRTIPQTINLGAAIDTGTKLSRMKFYLDLRDIANNVDPNFFKKTHIGAEIIFADVFGLTTGFNQGYPGVGAFFDIKVVRVDIGAYTQEMGSYAGSRGDTRLFFKISSGI